MTSDAAHTNVPVLFPLPRVGNAEEGFITIATVDGNIPFSPARVFWTNGTPPHVQRGGHAHRTTSQVLVCVHGSIQVETENRDGKLGRFLLNDPAMALFLPSMCWRTLRFQPGSVLLAMASTPFEHADYIRDKAEFVALARAT